MSEEERKKVKDAKKEVRYREKENRRVENNPC